MTKLADNISLTQLPEQYEVSLSNLRGPVAYAEGPGGCARLEAEMGGAIFDSRNVSITSQGVFTWGTSPNPNSSDPHFSEYPFANTRFEDSPTGPRTVTYGNISSGIFTADNTSVSYTNVGHEAQWSLPDGIVDGCEDTSPMHSTLRISYNASGNSINTTFVGHRENLTEPPDFGRGS